MKVRQSGFILIIVLGLLGVMAFLALHFAEVAHTTRILGVAHMDKGRSRLMARSGVERGLCQIQAIEISGGITSHEDIAIGEGTHAALGDRADVAVQEGAIDINDGIAAGLVEWGPDFYKADALDWDGPEPPPSGPPVLLFTTGPDDFQTMDWMPYGDEYHIFCLIPGLVKPGQFLKGIGDHLTGRFFRVLSAYDPDPTSINIPAGSSETYRVNDSLDIYNPNNLDFSHGFEVWGQPIAPPPTVDATRINVRLRTLLNAYGDVHKFVAERETTDTGYGTAFQYSSTTLVSFDHAMPSVDIRTGKYITQKDIARRWGRGLGDRVVCSRPQGGYRSVFEVEEIVNTWAAETLPSGYPASGTFFDLIQGDLAVGVVPDMAFTRLNIKQWVSALEPRCSEFGTRDVVKGPDFKPSMFNPMHLDMRPPNMNGIFKAHPVSAINLSTASVMARAAVFAALVNVGYLCESSRSFLYDNNSLKPSPLVIAENSIGVSGPVLRYPLLENGVEALPNLEDRDDGLPPVAVTHAAQLFMSVRDAIELSRGYTSYGAVNLPPRNFDEFRDFLLWYQAQPPVNGPRYEKCEAAGVPYNPDSLTGGWFTQDYVALTLPHVLSSVVRMPGYMGAPQALLSPVYAMKGFEPTSATDTNAKKLAYAQHAGSHPTRKAEDFVSRYLLPKVRFLSSGSYLISCRGRILGPRDEILAITTIQAVVQGSVQSTYLRSQKQFVEATDFSSLPPLPSTSPSILIGPEARVENQSNELGAPDFIQSRDYPHTCLGMVGLKDFEEPLVGSPQVIAHFNGHVTGDPGVSRIYAVSNDMSTYWDRHESYSLYDPVSAYCQNAGFSYGHFEWATQPLFAKGSKGTNLSPFGGVWSTSLENMFKPGSFLAMERNDNLFWRPMNRLDNRAPIRDGEVAGTVAGKGYLSVWVRLPSSHEGVTDPENGAVRVDARMNFRTIAHYNIFEMVPIATSSNYYFLTSMILGLGYDDKIGRYVIHARYGTKPVSWLHFGYPNGASSMWYALGEPIPTENYSSTGLMEFDNKTILCNYGSPLYADWYNNPAFLPIDQWSVNERWVVLRDPVTHPECGGGTWHKVSVGWNSHFYEADPKKNFWLKLHDGSNVDTSLNTAPEAEGYGIHNWNTGLAIPGPGRYSDFSNYHAHNYVFNLGSILSLGYNFRWTAFQYAASAGTKMVDVPGGTQFAKSGDPSNADPQPGLGYETCESPLCHLESLLDNVTLELGAPPAEISAAPRRYDVSASSHPEWTLDPNVFIPAGTQLITVGARIYDPRDSSMNFPDVDLDLMEGPALVTPTQAVNGGNPSLQRTERLRFYTGQLLKPSSRIRLKYRNHRPDGSLLVGDGSSDDWTEIPWIMEVMVRYDDGKPAKILNWHME